MTAEAQRLLEEAMKLPEEERAELAAILTDSIGDDVSTAELEQAWLIEAQRRLASIRARASSPVASEDVDRELDQLVAGADPERDMAR